MKIFPNKLTDSEYVERVRISLRRRWLKFSIFLSVSVVLFAVAYFTVYDLREKLLELYNILPEIEGFTYNESMVKASFGAGIAWGMVIFSLFFTAGSFLVQAMELAFNIRKDQMLVKYFDEAKKKKG